MHSSKLEIVQFKNEYVLFVKQKFFMLQDNIIALYIIPNCN